MAYNTTHIYSQQDPRWNGVKLGKSRPANGTIGNFGCAITAIANLHNLAFGSNITPLEVNNRLNQVGGFVFDSYGYSIILWSAVQKAFPRLKFVYRDPRYNNALVWSWINISPRMPVIVAVSTPRIPLHFVVFFGGGKMVDSLTGTVRSTGTYQTLIRSVRYTRT